MMWLDEHFESRKSQELETMGSVRAAIALDNFWHHFLRRDVVADTFVGAEPPRYTNRGDKRDDRADS